MLRETGKAGVAGDGGKGEGRSREAGTAREWKRKANAKATNMGRAVKEVFLAHRTKGLTFRLSSSILMWLWGHGMTRSAKRPSA